MFIFELKDTRKAIFSSFWFLFSSFVSLKRRKMNKSRLLNSSIPCFRDSALAIACSCEIEDFYVAMVRTTQKPNSSFVFCFAHLCPQLRSPSKALLGSLYSGYPPVQSKIASLISLSLHSQRQLSKVFVLAARSSRPAAHFAQYALILLAKRSRAKARFIRVCSCGIKDFYVAVVVLNRQSSSLCRLSHRLSH